MAEPYIALVASLPYLPPFERAEWSPITRLRLNQRLHSLEPDDAGQLAKAEALVSWRISSTAPHSDMAMLLNYRAAKQEILHPSLQEYIAFRIDQQMILAALRLRHAGFDASVLDQIAGVSRWVKLITAHWDDPDFKLQSVYPWLPIVRSHLESDDARSLDQTVMNVIWHRLSRIAETNRFGFEAVFAFVFKWDILQAWLARDAGKAKIRFQELIKEVKNDS